MIALLRAECRKLLTVRSTYIITVIALLLVAFLSFYIEGYKGMMPLPEWLTYLMNNVSTTISIFVAIMAILLIGHEYRYNTITYTLAAANSRTKVLLAKICTVATFALVLTVIAWGLAFAAYWCGVQLSPNQLQQWVTPQLEWEAVWRGAFFVVSFGLLGLVLGFLFRHLVGSIAALFILPTVEGILSPLLKENVKYLPFSLLEQVHIGVSWKPFTAACLFAAYLGTLWLVAWYLFIRRDAN
ncbi:MAG TPA: ABC transporter permease [Candidatus Saccharimonadales bacterium]|nr:ABC transporter permease [Candidatus Saccharimonadales bacterium]